MIIELDFIFYQIPLLGLMNTIKPFALYYSHAQMEFQHMALSLKHDMYKVYETRQPGQGMLRSLCVDPVYLERVNPEFNFLINLFPCLAVFWDIENIRERGEGA